MNIKAHTASVPVSTSADGVIRLPARKPPATKLPGVIGGHHNNACWCMESHCKWKWHTPQFQGAMNWSHTCPHYLWNHSHSLSSPHIWCPFSHYLSILQVSAVFSAFSLQVHHTSDHSLQVQAFKGPMVTHKNQNPP